jgi:hypothetical protein
MVFCGFLTFVGTLFLHRYDGRILREHNEAVESRSLTA